MNQTTSTIEPPKSTLGERNAIIAVAIFTLPEACSVILCKTCLKLLATALRRSSVPIIAEWPVFNPASAVSIFAVPWSQRTAAVESLKQVLAELDLLEGRAVLAARSAEEVWIVMHGVGLGVTGAEFEKVFLPENHAELTLAAFVKHAADFNNSFELLLRESEHLVRERGENLEAP